MQSVPPENVSSRNGCTFASLASFRSSSGGLGALPRGMQLVGRDYTWVVEPGAFTASVGGASDALPLSATFAVVAT